MTVPNHLRAATSADVCSDKALNASLDVSNVQVVTSCRSDILQKIISHVAAEARSFVIHLDLSQMKGQ